MLSGRWLGPGELISSVNIAFKDPIVRVLSPAHLSVGGCVVAPVESPSPLSLPLFLSMSLITAYSQKVQ